MKGKAKFHWQTIENKDVNYFYPFTFHPWNPLQRGAFYESLWRIPYLHPRIESVQFPISKMLLFCLLPSFPSWSSLFFSLFLSIKTSVFCSQLTLLIPQVPWISEKNRAAPKISKTSVMRSCSGWGEGGSATCTVFYVGCWKDVSPSLVTNNNL